MKMKGITCCGDCVYYNIKKHKCIRCENVEPEDAREHFYADCPLPDAEPVRYGKWEGYHGEKFCKDGEYRHYHFYVCNNCGRRTAVTSKYCPDCGCRMDGD